MVSPLVFNGETTGKTISQFIYFTVVWGGEGWSGSYGDWGRGCEYQREAREKDAMFLFFEKMEEIIGSYAFRVSENSLALKKVNLKRCNTYLT